MPSADNSLEPATFKIAGFVLSNHAETSLTASSSDLFSGFIADMACCASSPFPPSGRYHHYWDTFILLDMFCAISSLSPKYYKNTILKIAIHIQKTRFFK